MSSLRQKIHTEVTRKLEAARDRAEVLLEITSDWAAKAEVEELFEELIHVWKDFGRTQFGIIIHEKEE